MMRRLFLMLCLLPLQAQAQDSTVNGNVVSRQLNILDPFEVPRVSLFPSGHLMGDPYTPPDYLQLGGLTNQGGSGLLIRGQPYGYYDTGCLLSSWVGPGILQNTRAGVNGGFEQGVPAMATYSSADMVNECLGIQSLPPVLTLTGVTYDAGHIYPPAGQSFSKSQVALLRRSMWIMTNSVDPTVVRTSTVPQLPPFLPSEILTPNTYGSTVIGWSLNADGSASSILVSGWTVPGSGHTAAGQVPTAATPQTVYLGSPTKQFAHNDYIVLNPNGNPGSQTNAMEDNEIDMFDYDTVDHAGSMHGITCQYTPFGISTVTGKNVLPSSDSRCYYGGGQNLPVVYQAGESPQSASFKSNVALINGGLGSDRGSIGATWTMFEMGAYADGSNNMRYSCYMQSDVTSATVIGWQAKSIHCGLMIDGAMATRAGVQMGEVVYNDHQKYGAVALQSSSGSIALRVSPDNSVNVLSSLVVAQVTPASSSAPCTQGQTVDDANYHYACVAANSWKRVALSAF